MNRPLITLSLLLLVALVGVGVSVSAPTKKNENFYNRLMARCLGGETEVKLEYSLNGKPRRVEVDIATNDYWIEAGLDKRSSRDSIHQALFYAVERPDKKPMVIIYDRDGVEGATEYQIRRIAEKWGFAYRRVSVGKLTARRCPSE